MKKIMKRIIMFLVLMCLMISAVSALVPYGGAPSVPYIIFGHVEWNEQMLSGSRMRITNQNTGYTSDFATDPNGYWQQEGGNWLTISSGRPPLMYGDVVQIEVLDGCGNADICVKTFTAYEGDYKDYAKVNLFITGELSCPPVSCSPCSCGGGSSCSYTESKCRSRYPCETCDATVCPKPVFTKAKCNTLYPPEKCDECSDSSVCPACPEEKTCPICPAGNMIELLLYGLFGIAVGGAGIYFYKKREAVVKHVGVKTYVGSDGKIKLLHRHPGIRGYHSPETMHKVEYERHPKGEMTPLYEKNDKGVFEYKE